MFDNKANNPAIALSYFLKGLRLLTSKGLRQFLLVPLLINLVLYSLAFTLGYHYLAEYINQSIPGWLQWLRWIVWPLFFISYSIAVYFTFTLLANLLAAPFYGRLSAKTLAIVSGQTTEIVELPVLKVILAELRRALYLVVRALPLIVLSVIPVINLFALVLWALFSAWGMALEYMAYPMENAGLLFSEQKRQLRAIRFGALSFGGIAALGMTIPLLNIFVAPAAVIGATLYYQDLAGR